jgi:hypothetical protein
MLRGVQRECAITPVQDKPFEPSTFSIGRSA